MCLSIKLITILLTYTLSGICYFETVITLSKYEIGIF